MIKYRFLYYILFSISIINFANANIIVDRMVVDVFPNDEKQQNVFVHNVGDDVAYVESEVFEIKNPGEDNETRTPIDIKNKNRLIVIPNRLTIEPSEKSRLQFIMNDVDLKKDRIYRVSIAPKISGVEGNSGIGIKVLIGYDILVIARANKPKFDMKVKRSKESITFINNGNTNILLNDVKQCRNDKCTTILSKRLYAGNKLVAKLVYRDEPVITEIFYGTEAKTEKY